MCSSHLCVVRLASLCTRVICLIILHIIILPEIVASTDYKIIEDNILLEGVGILAMPYF